MAIRLSIMIEPGDEASHSDATDETGTDEYMYGHPNIHRITAHLRPNTVPPCSGAPSSVSLLPCGSIKAQLLDTGRMRNTSASSFVPGHQFYIQCQAYDADYADQGARLEKVENFLVNESFKPEYEARVADANKVLFIEEVYLYPWMRGEGRSLWMVAKLIRALALGGEAVVLLQAGGVSREVWSSAEGEGGGEGTEKLTRHWKKTGFSEWSDSDDAWLCLDPAEL